jgi:secreted PhoX family phosphatase
VGAAGRLAVYMGDDERFDYVYTFVPEGRVSPGGAAANRDLLDSGTLYAAKFNDDGSGEWIPLVAGQGALTADTGFATQAEILITTRLAGDAVGATKMDRPEDIEVNPVTQTIYMAMTNNTSRTAEQVNGANPREMNRHGHILEVTEAGNDPTASRARSA